MEDGRRQIAEFLWPDDLTGTPTHGARSRNWAPTHVAAADLSRAHQQMVLMAIRTAQLYDRVAMIELRENRRGALMPCQRRLRADAAPAAYFALTLFR
jgi:hypothetical protein